MRIFSALYNKVLTWSKHRHAPYYLGGMSFMESSFFPIPPDVMLAPMSLARPHRAIFYATITTITSVLGALFGYIIGMFFFHFVQPLLVHFGYMDTYNLAQGWFSRWGFWVLFIAAFSPIPFKVFTIAGGALHTPLLPFIVGSFIGRGARFYLVSLLMMYFGERMDRMLRKCIDWLGWIVVIILIATYIAYKWWV